MEVVGLVEVGVPAAVILFEINHSLIDLSD